MDLRKLRHLLALGEFGNFARAAESVHLTQPAFSRSIKSLEEDLGVPLFVRGKRKVTPTPFGEVAVSHARRLLWETNSLRRDVALMKTNEIGDVLLGMGPLPAAMLLPPVLTRVTKDTPGIRTRVEIMDWQQLLQLLETEKLDFFIADCRELSSGDRISISRMPKIIIKWFCRAKHPILRKKSVLGLDLLAYPLGCCKLPAVAFAELTQLFGFDGDPQKFWTLQCDNFSITERVASQTDMIILMPEFAFRDEIRRGNIVEVKLASALTVVAHMGVVTLRNRVLSPAAEHIIRLLHEELSALVDRNPVRASAVVHVRGGKAVSPDEG